MYGQNYVLIYECHEPLRGTDTMRRFWGPGGPCEFWYGVLEVLSHQGEMKPYAIAPPGGFILIEAA